jgi:hypothetical protein
MLLQVSGCWVGVEPQTLHPTATVTHSESVVTLCQWLSQCQPTSSQPNFEQQRSHISRPHTHMRTKTHKHAHNTYPNQSPGVSASQGNQSHRYQRTSHIGSTHSTSLLRWRLAHPIAAPIPDMAQQLLLMLRSLACSCSTAWLVKAPNAWRKLSCCSHRWHAAAVAPCQFAAGVQGLCESVLVALPVLVLVVRHQALHSTHHSTARGVVSSA